MKLWSIRVLLRASVSCSSSGNCRNEGTPRCNSKSSKLNFIQFVLLIYHRKPPTTRFGSELRQINECFLMVLLTGNLLTSFPTLLVRRQLSRLSAVPSRPLIEEKGDAGILVLQGARSGSARRR